MKTIKKILAIVLMIAILVVPVFAVTEGNSVILRSTLTEQTDYTFVLSFDQIALPGQTETGFNASAEQTAYFKIVSNSSMNFDDDPAPITINLSITNWESTTLGTLETNAITLNTLEKTDDIVTANTTAKTYVVDFEEGYKEAFSIGTFSVSWDAKPSLSFDDYVSTIKIEYNQV